MPLFVEESSAPFEKFLDRAGVTVTVVSLPPRIPLFDRREIARVTKYGQLVYVYVFFFQIVSQRRACPERSFCTTSVVLIR